MRPSGSGSEVRSERPAVCTISGRFSGIQAMRLQTERCMQCGTLNRPTNLQSKYDMVLDETGAVTITDFWFCSDRCFEDACEKFLEPEFSFKYLDADRRMGPNLPPRLKKTINAIVRYHHDCDKWIDLKAEYKRRFGELPEDGHAYAFFMSEKEKAFNRAIRDWIWERDTALNRAVAKIADEIHAENIHYTRVSHAKEMDQMTDRIARAEHEQQRLEEKRKREEEKQEREAYRQQREQERLEEKRQREAERQAKEEAERLAREAEEEKWKPKRFKL
jgi:hypothetical protein